MEQLNIYVAIDASKDIKYYQDFKLMLKNAGIQHALFDSVDYFKELDKTNKLQGITVTMIYPAKSDFDNFIKRYQQRGNSDIFMKYNHVVHFNEWVEMFDEEQSFNKINIGSNEYLENILIKLGISLIEK